MQCLHCPFTDSNDKRAKTTDASVWARYRVCKTCGPLHPQTERAKKKSAWKTKASRPGWIKQCHCRGATATAGRTVIRQQAEGATVKWTTTHHPGPVCNSCDTAWKQGLV